MSRHILCEGRPRVPGGCLSPGSLAIGAAQQVCERCNMTCMDGWVLGLGVETDYPITGIPEDAVPLGSAQVRIDVVSHTSLQERWRAAQLQPVMRRSGPNGQGMRLEHRPAGGPWGLAVEGFGEHLIEPDG